MSSGRPLPVGYPIYKAISILFTIIYLIDLVVFVWMARIEASLHHRGVLLTFVHVAASISANVLVLTRFPNHPVASCKTAIWLRLISITLWVTSMTLKYWRHLWLYDRQQYRFLRQRAIESRQRRESRRYARAQATLPPPSPLSRSQSDQSHDLAAMVPTRQSHLTDPVLPTEPETVQTAQRPPTAIPTQTLKRFHSFSAYALSNCSLEDGLDGTLEVMHPLPPQRVATWPPYNISSSTIRNILPTELKAPQRQSFPVILPSPVSSETPGEQTFIARLSHWLVNVRVLQPKYHGYVVLFVLFLNVSITLCLFIAMTGYLPSPTDYTSDCVNQYVNIPTFSLAVIYAAIMLPIMMVLAWRVPDVHGIRAEMLLQGAAAILVIVIYALFRSPLGPGWTRLRLEFPTGMVVMIGLCFSHFLAVLWPIVRALNLRRVAARIPLSQTTVNLQYGMTTEQLEETVTSFDAFMRALDNPQVREDLEQFSIRDFTFENIAFLYHLRQIDLILLYGDNTVYVPNYYSTLSERNRDATQASQTLLPSNGEPYRRRFRHLDVRHIPGSNLLYRIAQPTTQVFPTGSEESRVASPMLVVTPRPTPVTQTIPDSEIDLIYHSPPVIEQDTAFSSMFGSIEHINRLPNAEQIRDRLKYIYEEFIAPHSPNEINLSADCRENIILAYEHNRLSLQVLQEARMAILRLVFLNTWPRLLREKQGI